MTEEIKDGGQAFPQPIAVSPMGDNYPAYPGMTLRAYFAAHAPYTLADVEDIWHGTKGDEHPTWRDLLKLMAGLRFAYADQMIKEMNGEAE